MPVLGLEKIGKKIKILKRKKMVSILKSLKPARLENHSRKTTLRAFRNAARRLKAYRSILEEHGVDWKQIETFEDFKNRVPIIDKNLFFQRFQYKELCLNGDIDRVSGISTSSGTSNSFSFALSSEAGNKQASEFGEMILDHFLGISTQRTFVFNCNPMGVRIPLNLPTADTCVNTGSVLNILKKIHRDYDQFVFASEIHFLKKLLEDGVESGIQWKTIRANFIVGADWMPESMRCYFEHILHTDYAAHERMVVMNMGLTELATSLGNESVETIMIRKEARKNPALARDLFGSDKMIPEVICYYPMNTYVESLPNDHGTGELVYSSLSETSLMPLIRYNSKDWGKVIPYGKMKSVLEKYNLSGLIPEFKLPMIAMYGRSGDYLLFGDKKVYSQEVRGRLYEDFDLASKFTGHFKMKNENNRLMVKIQLKEETSPTEALRQRYQDLLRGSSEADVQLVPYYDYHPALTVNYEKKIRHIDS